MASETSGTAGILADSGADDPWATLDELLGIDVATVNPDEHVGDVAFYGRCSTEDKQDPKTSRNWQLGNARKFVEPVGGQIRTEFFDQGQSRSVPWERRDQARKLLAELKNPHRGWDTIVVGEGTRCWFGSQFSMIAPRLTAYGVDLWVPELGGRYDPRNPSHNMLMSVLGGMSEAERQHVQSRVRAAMDAQVLNEGRHQGGRTPYGYLVVDGGPHPNPRKAVEGYRLRVLAIDEDAAEAVRRIFAAYLDGLGDRAIAGMLNRDGVPCPSARRPEQNRHRMADGWQGSTVRAILDNPRYTGYAIFGRWARHEMLIDPDDVPAGHVVKFRRATADQIVRSREPAHPEIVSVQDFTAVQVLRRTKSARGLSSARKAERGPRPAPKRVYALRGMVRCGVCQRRMQGEAVRTRSYYRCTSRTMAPGAAALAAHPPTVNLREDHVVPVVNEWIGWLFAPHNVDATVAALVGDQRPGVPSIEVDAARDRLADAEQRVRRHQAAIDAGIDPAALKEAINAAQADRAAAQAAIDAAGRTGKTLDVAEVWAMIDSLGNVGEALNSGDETRLAKLYRELDLGVRYQPSERAVYMTARPRVDSECVRGGT